MSSNQSGEGDIRKALIEADLVDCMVAMPTQLFLTVQIPVWLVDSAKNRNKGDKRYRDRQNEVLFIDARKLGFMADRTRRDFTDDDIAQIAKTYHAWRGEKEAGRYKDVLGFCKRAALEEVRSHQHVLTPGQAYVGTEDIVDDDEPFEGKMQRLVDSTLRSSGPWALGSKRRSARTSNGLRMRADAKTMRIGDLGRVVKLGRTPPGNDDRYYGDAIPFLTPTDMGELRRVERPSRFLSPFGAAELGRCLVHAGVGVSCIGWQMGKSVLIDRATITNQQINSIEIHEDIADRVFVYYALRARRQEFFNLGAAGSRTPILNKGDFERLPFVLPALSKQQAVATILGALDDKLELNRRMYETLEETARALFKSWFVDFDPVEAKAVGRQPLGMNAATAALFPAAASRTPLLGGTEGLESGHDGRYCAEPTR